MALTTRRPIANSGDRRHQFSSATRTGIVRARTDGSTDMFGASFVLTPAYGRVYNSKRSVLADYNAGKDFLCQPEGRYANINDIAAALATHVQIRYGKRLEKVMVV